MEKETIIASFTYLIFYSDLNGFCVSTFKEKLGQKTKNIKCIGNNLPQYKNIDYELTGEWQKDKNGDMQFKVDSFSEHIEKEKDSIIAFLSSGAIKGIGKKTAERIYEMYGDDSLEVIEKRPENLLRVRGITNKKLDEIIASYTENHLPKDLIELLMPNGFTTKNVIKVYRTYRNEYMEKINEDPYKMCDISGITFPMCDRVGRSLGIKEDAPIRLQGAINEAIKANYFSGKVGAKTSEIIKRAIILSGFNDKIRLHNELIFMAKAGFIDYKRVALDEHPVTYFYHKEVRQAEESLAKEIVKNLGRKDKSKEAEESLLKNSSITFDTTQKTAIINAFRYRLSIITGGPGTGKTTITKKIAEINKEITGEEPIFLAPTGKAARRMSESTGIEAHTIHSFLNLRPSGDEDAQYQEAEHIMIKDKCVVIDEFSMVDMMLAKTLFERMDNCRIIIVGDPDQLQSVGAGNVLLDMINSRKIPTAKLTFEHRQGEGSTIKSNANGMQNGLRKFETADDFYCEYVEARDSESTLKAIEDRMVEEYLRYYRLPEYSSVLCLCPYRSYTAGTYSVNNRLQEILNPKIDGAPEFKGTHDMVFRVGDPVMHVERNTEEVSNGNTGTVKAIKKVDNVLTLFAEFDLGKQTVIVEYTSQNIQCLTLAYAMTVHKSQGSEYDAIVTCLTSFHRMMLKRRIPYTAITRASTSVSIFLDSKQTLERAIDNNSTEDRNTLLEYHLRQSGAKTAAEKKVYNTKKGELEGQLSLAFT